MDTPTRQRPNQRTDLPRLLTIEEVADHLSVTTRHVRRLVSERRIPFVKWGHLLRFDPRDMDAWIEAGRRERR